MQYVKKFEEGYGYADVDKQINDFLSENENYKIALISSIPNNHNGSDYFDVIVVFDVDE